MKTIVKALALSAVLGFACLPVTDAAASGNCRYLCGTTTYETYLSNCCSRTVTCPNGQTTNPYAELRGSLWRFCGPIG